MVRSNALKTLYHASDEDFTINGPISNRVKKKELLLDEVGTVFGEWENVHTMGEKKFKQNADQMLTNGNGYIN